MKVHPVDQDTVSALPAGAKYRRDANFRKKIVEHAITTLKITTKKFDSSYCIYIQ
jgi:hypothetical protein